MLKSNGILWAEFIIRSVGRPMSINKRAKARRKEWHSLFFSLYISNLSWWSNVSFRFLTDIKAKIMRTLLRFTDTRNGWKDPVAFCRQSRWFSRSQLRKIGRSIRAMRCDELCGTLHLMRRVLCTKVQVIPATDTEDLSFTISHW